MKHLWPGIIVAWCSFLIGALLWPFATPGGLLHRDMAVLAHPALSPSALGFGDLPARNAPQDGLLALVGMLIDASWFARFLLLSAAILGCVGARDLARACQSGRLGTLLAITMTTANPFVVERLLQGQWSLVVAAWLVPGIAVWSSQARWSFALPALWLASLTPTGAVIASVVALVSRPRWLLATYCVTISLPWLVPSLLSRPTTLGAGASIFAPRAEHLVGTAGSLVGLGGIWNAQAVPASREHGWALAGVLLFLLLLLGSRRVPRRWLVLASIGLCGAFTMSMAPSVAEFCVVRIPGAALFRDSHKLVMLAIPAYAFLSAHIRSKQLASVAIVLALLQVWDAPGAVEKLRPVPEPVLISESREMFVPDLQTLVFIDGTATVNPLAKAASVVENGQLTVDGTVVDPPSERFVAASERYAAGDLAGLAELGIDVVYDHGRVVEIAEHPRAWTWWLGLLLLLSWILVCPAVLLLRLALRRRDQAL